jgi:hypothetical protein
MKENAVRVIIFTATILQTAVQAIPAKMPIITGGVSEIYYRRLFKRREASV